MTATAVPVMAVATWPTNGHLIADCHRLGYIHGAVLDPTFGNGTWWNTYRPDDLTAVDLDPRKSPDNPAGVDFTALPWRDATFDTVAFDPPYKLNGTATLAVDERYGVHAYNSQADRHQLIRAGMKECARVLAPQGHLLVKCQDQVNGGRVRWQTHEFAAYGQALGLGLVDQFHPISYRPQPAGRSQQHARRNHSTLLVFVKPKAAT